MSWLNLNQSLSSIKGQITNFASEVLSEGITQENEETAPETNDSLKVLEEKCKNQEAELESLKKLTQDLQERLHHERQNRQDGDKEDDPNWFWDPVTSPSRPNSENEYKTQIQALRDEISNMKDRQTVDIRNVDNEEEITKLREENKLLAGNLEELDRQHQSAIGKLLGLKQELQENFEVLKRQHSELQINNEELVQENKMFEHKMKQKDKEIENLFADKTDYDTIHRKYQNLERIYGLLRENAEKFQEENQELHEEVFKLQEQITKLEHGDTNINLDDFVHKKQYESVVKELNDLRERRNNNQMHLDTRNIDDNAKGVINDLKMQIEELKYKLNERDSTSLADHLEKLYEKYVTFNIPTEYIDAHSKGPSLMQRVEMAFKSLYSFKNDIDVITSQAASQKKELTSAQNNVEQLTTENELLLTDVSNLEKALGEMKKNNDFLLDELATIKNVSKLQPIVENDEENLLKLETQLEDCTKQKMDFETKITLVEIELNAVKKEKIELQKNLDDLKLKYVAMVEEFETFKTEFKAIDDLELSLNATTRVMMNPQLNVLKQELNRANVEREKMSIDLHINDNDKVLLVKTIDDLKRSLHRKDLELANLKSQKEQLESKVLELKLEVNDDRKSEHQDIANILADLTKPSPSLEVNKLEYLDTENAELKTNVQSLTEELATCQSKNDKLLAQDQNVDSDNKALVKSLDQSQLGANNISKEFEDLKEYNIKLMSSNEELLNKTKEIEAQLNETLVKLSDCNKKIKNLEDKNLYITKELQSKEALIESLNSTIDEHFENITSIKTQMNDVENNIILKDKEILRLSKDRDEFSDKYTTANKEIQLINEKHIADEKGMRGQMKHLEEQLQIKNNEIEYFKNETEVLKTSSNDYKVQLEVSFNLIKQINNTINNFTLTKDVHFSKKGDLRVIDDNQLVKAINELKANITNILQKKEKLEIEYKNMKEKLECELNEMTHKNAIDKCSEENIQLQEEVNNMKENIKAMETQTFDLDSERKRLEHKAELLVTSNTYLTSKKEKLIKEIDGLKFGMTNLEHEKHELFIDNQKIKRNFELLKNNKKDLVVAQYIEEKAKLLDEIVELQNNVKVLTEEKEMLAIKNAKLSEQLNTTLKEINEDTLYSNILTEKANLTQKLEEMKINMTKYHQSDEILHYEKNNLKTELNQTLEKNAELSKEKGHLDQEVKDLKNHFDKILKERDLLKIENNNLKDNIKLALHDNKHETLINNLIQEKEKLTTEITTLKWDINQLFSEKKALQNERDNIQEKLLTALKEKSSSIDVTNLIEENDKLLKEKHNLTAEIETLNHNLADSLQEKEKIDLLFNKTQARVLELEDTVMKIEATSLDYEASLANITKEKLELIGLVNFKHNESVQYHSEIQRLNAIIQEHSNEFQKIIQEKNAILSDCKYCEKLNVTLKEKDSIITTLSQNTSELEKIKGDLNATIKELSARCVDLDKALTIQMESVKKLTIENQKILEREANTARELDRLRKHLMELEENHTQELMASEQKLTEVTTRLHQVEERAKQNSTVYTSNSIRANQEVETIRNQLKLLEKQRDDVQSKLTEAEDSNARSEAALTNLQLVLQQFQLDKDRDIEAATEKLQNKMAELSTQNSELQNDISRLNHKLSDTLAGLQAATRLGDQLENKTALINDLKEQVRALQSSVQAAEERYQNTISNQQDRVDKNLVKNLLVNFVAAHAQNATNRTQVLRILSSVLDFNQDECSRVGLTQASTSESLASEFVKFLQKESTPSTPLPSMMRLTRGPEKSTPSPTPYEMGHKRNTSTGSNNLLFQNIDSVETSSQISIDNSSVHSDRDKPPLSMNSPETSGYYQTRNSEGAILKYVLKDMQP